MKLSVIIVNYNVKAYLEQCLRTVEEAMKGVSGDVYVVDNLSTDGSVQMVMENFPSVKLIANTENVGFSRANNQAIRASDAEYVVLLNPDTVVGEDVFRDVVAYMDAAPKVGGLGVKMIDGTGRFLPESKRGLPTPAVAFYKIIGLTRLFPKSKVFGRYQLGHLPENETNPIEILSGACMFLRKETLNKVGLLDESFFMYGEDIDLSYRITLGGYENHYFPKARIIHYKGESTKKSSVNYVFVFYNAMAIFARKHFTGRRTDIYSILINGAIYLSATTAIIARFLGRALLPLLDIALFAGIGSFIALSSGGEFQPTRTLAWGIILLLSFALTGAYDKPVRISNVLKGTLLFGLVRALQVGLFMQWSTFGPYSTIPVLLEVGVVGAVGLLARMLLHATRVKGYGLRDRGRRRVLAIGTEAEAEKALSLLWQTHFGLGWKEVLDPALVGEETTDIRSAMRPRQVDEVVFCAKDLPWNRIIRWMEELASSGAQFKIAQPGSSFIIGPNSIESLQDLFVMEYHGVQSAASHRRKRVVDVAMSLFLLLTLPVNIWFVRRPWNYIGNIGLVLLGRRTWVGYHPLVARALRLPALPIGVVDPVSVMQRPVPPVAADRINVEYAKDYRPWRDVRHVLQGLPLLGGSGAGRRA